MLNFIKICLKKNISFKGLSSFFSNDEFSFSQRRLANILKEHAGTYTINKDGFVSIDLSNPEVIKKIVEQINKCDGIKVERA